MQWRLWRLSHSLYHSLFLIFFFIVELHVAQGITFSTHNVDFSSGTNLRHNFCARAQAVYNGSLPIEQGLRGQHLSIGTGLWSDIYLREDKTTGELAGVELKILDALASRAGFTFDLYLHNWTTLDSWTTALKETSPLYDMITHSYWTISLERAMQGSYSPFGFLDGSTMMVAPEANVYQPSTLQTMLQFMEPFSLSLWFTVGAVTLATGLIYSLLESKCNEDDFQPDRGSVGQIVEGFCKAFYQLASAGEFSPKTWPGTILLGSWAWCAMLLIAGYTANLTTFLVVRQKAVVRIESLPQAIRQNRTICYCEGCTEETFFKAKYRGYTNVRTGADLVEIGKFMEKGGLCDVILLAKHAYDEITAERQTDPQCKWKIVGQPLTSLSSGYMMYADYTDKCTSAARDMLQVTFMQLVSDGLINRLFEDSFSDLGLRSGSEGCAAILAAQAEYNYEQAAQKKS